ncbi:MAG: putative ABC transporter, permease component [Clostridiales bacterium 38_11]|nr:MAG: putative ABC transporter, permease component [Clostridiales bacterium 38_11]HBH12779.1 ABC transporter permease [Clostridiales bacterium]
MRVSISSNRNRLIGITIILVFWQVLFMFISKDIYLPSPLNVIRSFVQITTDKDFFSILSTTTLRVLLSFAISTFIGVLTGLVCGLNKTIYEIFEPMIVLIRSTPVISIIIIALIWFRSDYAPIFTGFLMCFPVIWSNVVQGIKSTDQHLIEMSKIYKVMPVQIIRTIYIPSAKPFIAAGLTTSLGLAWKVIAAAEVLSLPKYGIGSKLHDSKIYLESDKLLAWTLLIIIISYLFELILMRVFSMSNKKYDNVLEDL